MGNFIDITGLIFGKLIVIEKISKKMGRDIMWACECECGNIKVVRAADLKNGKTKSCGCIIKKMLLDRNTKHGMSSTRIYEIWQGMIKRCTNKNAQYYHLYGGRGIKVCDRWMDFKLFYDDTSPTYSEGLSIDRFPDKDGDYEPNNFRWATNEEQSTNKRNNHLLEFNNKNQTISQWSKEVGLCSKLIQSRIKNGWSPEKALTFPIQKVTSNRRDLKGWHVWNIQS